MNCGGHRRLLSGREAPMAGILLEGDHVTDEERAAHARALALKERENR